MRNAWIGLGANLGDAAQTLRHALQALSIHPDIATCQASGFYRTAPVDAHGPDYINAVARVQTCLAPPALLDLLQEIERTHGRQRPYPNAPRTLDLDLLMVENETCSTQRLTLPHPRMHQRAFVLRPLLDLEPGLVLPQGSVQNLLSQLADQDVFPYQG